MTSDKPYRSYLIRCWVSAQPAPGNGSHGRFVVERISGAPQRWGFDTFEDMIAFLRATLLEQDLEPRGGSPPGDAG